MTSPNYNPRTSTFVVPDAPSIADVARLVTPPNISRADAPLCSSGQANIYLAGCPALAQIARAIGVHILKLGVTTKAASERILGLNKIRYAGYWGHKGSLKPLQGADQWCHFKLRSDAIGGDCHRNFVTLGDTGHLSLSVPPTIQRAHVDAAVSRVFEARSLRAFLLSDEGRLRCAQAGIDPESWFWTQYAEPAPAGILRPVRELFLLDPVRDADMMMGALEALGAHFHRNAGAASMRISGA